MKITSGIVVVTMLAVAGCYGYGRAGVAVPTAEVTVHTAPPPLRTEIVVSSPGEGYVWIPGYWDWDGAAYVWIGGTWQYAEPGYVWVRPHYVRRSSGWVYLHGYFNESRTHRRVYDAREFHRRGPPPRRNEHEHSDHGRHRGWSGGER